MEFFKKLDIIAYKDISINGLLIRILGIHYMPHMPDWAVKRHKHSFYEFHYVLEHSVLSTINNREYEIPAQHFYIMPPGSYHSHRQEKGKGHIGFALRWEFVISSKDEAKSEYLHTDILKKTLENAVTKPVFDENNKVINSMINLLVKAGNNKGASSSTLDLQLNFCSLLIEISDFYRDKAIESSSRTHEVYLENNTVSNAIKFIDENYCEDIDVNEIANSVHLSYSHLSRLFKKYTGGTINLHINKIRLNHAQRLLLCTNKSLAQIACETGFSNENYFCNVFKKFYNVSPGNFRSSKSNQLSE